MASAVDDAVLEIDEDTTAAERLRRREAKALADLRRQEEEEARRQRQLEHAELVSMRVEERRQCAHQDRFWGLDFLAYEQEREAWERSLMAEEEALVWALIRARRRDEEAEERRHAEALARLQAEELKREHAETIAMAVQEGLQTAIDRFWGIDTHEEQRRAAAERQLELQEERRQKEEAHRLRKLQAEWKQAGEEMLRQKRVDEARQQELIRQNYMALFFNATSSADVINFKWPTFTEAEEELYSRVPTCAEPPSSGGGFEMDVVFSPERVLAPYHTLHKLNPVKTVGKRHLQLDDAGRNFELVPDLRPGAGPGVPPVAHSPSLTTLPSKRDQVAAHHQAAAALRHKRRNSTSAGAMQWPVPSLNSRDGHHVTLRGWIMSASPVVRHHNNQAKLEKNLKKYPRTYCAVFRSSILFLFDSVEDFRDFFKQGPQLNNTASGYIDLETAVAVRERKPEWYAKKCEEAESAEAAMAEDGGPASASASADSAGAGGGAGAGAGAGAQEEGKAAASGSDAGSDGGSGGDGDGDGDGASGGDGDGESKSAGSKRNSQASATAAKAGSTQDTPALRVLEIVCVGQSWLVVPDPSEEAVRAAREAAEAEEDLQKENDKLAKAKSDLETRAAESKAAERKGPREGNYRKRLRVQGAQLAVKASMRNIAGLNSRMQEAQDHLEHVRDHVFDQWHNAIADAVSARNHDLHDVTEDPELTKPVAEVDPSRLTADTADLVTAVGLAKLGPWAMPVHALPLVEKLTSFHRTLVAGASSGSPLAKLRIEARGMRTGTGLQRGRVNVVKSAFGFIRPDDKSGDKDIVFSLDDCVQRVNVSDIVTFDTKRDERSNNKKDMRAVNVCKVMQEPYLQYDDLDTMGALSANAASMWCVESLQARSSSATRTSKRGSQSSLATTQQLARRTRGSQGQLLPGVRVYNGSNGNNNSNNNNSNNNNSDGDVGDDAAGSAARPSISVSANGAAAEGALTSTKSTRPRRRGRTAKKKKGGTGKPRLLHVSPVRTTTRPSKRRQRNASQSSGGGGGGGGGGSGSDPVSLPQLRPSSLGSGGKPTWANKPSPIGNGSSDGRSSAELVAPPINSRHLS